MDKKFLNKVVDQLVSETRIDYNERKIYFPFSSTSLFFPSPLPSFFSHPSSYFSTFSLSFFKHCREVYGLNDDEVGYVWDKYREIIKDKIESNGL